MDITMYDFLVIFVVVPILLFKFTLIPGALFKQIRGMNPIVRNVLIGIFLAIASGVVVATCSQGMALRFGAFAVAVLICVIHYTYTSKKYEENKSDPS
ncbi:MAG: hypothetical protein IJU40_06575 [Desulfovibrionaceae bacterium]|nr:hypothetical protein [Desulfovibrionaceae bacterium]